MSHSDPSGRSLVTPDRVDTDGCLTMLRADPGEIVAPRGA
jgi:hypothetical protein